MLPYFRAALFFCVAHIGYYSYLTQPQGTMMKMRTGLLLLAGVVVLACVMSSVNARVMEGAAVAGDAVATATPMKPISTVISWKTGKKYGDKYAHKHSE